MTALFGGSMRFNLPQRDFAAGRSPIAVVAADFNGDGVTDLAVSDLSSVSILLGTGAGQFASPVVYQTGGNQPWSIVTADFNGDGHLDLAVGQTSQLTVLLGKGDGTFTLAPTQPTGLRAYFVVTGDFNRDGKADLATTDAIAGTVHVLYGNGDGSFRVGKAVTATSSALGLAAADFNGDKRLDLVVAGSDAVAVLLAEGNGTFSSPESYPVQKLNGPVSVGDLNGDSHPDIVTTGVNGIAVLLGTGDGKFNVLPQFGSDAADRIAIGDWNGDGLMDLAAPLSSTAGLVQIYIGKGDGTFTSGAAIPVGSAPYWVIAAHINEGKALDLVSANIVGNTVSVLLGHGDGTFGNKPLSLGSGASGASWIVAGDVNGDGLVDLVTSNATTNNVSVLLGQGKGRFAPAAVFPTGGTPRSVALGDFNRDGKMDIVTADFGSGTVSVLFGNGDGTFQLPQSHQVGIQTQSVATGDMNNDGIPDIVVASVQTATVSTLLSNGDGTFQPPIVYYINNGFAGITQLALTDVNSDGKLDVVGEYFYGSGLSVLGGKGDGSLALLDCICGPPYPSGLAVADFNNDGLPDVSFGSANLLQVDLNAGGGKFNKPVSSSAPQDPTLLGAGDFNGDGFQDLVSTGLNTNVLTFATGKGDGTFGPGPTYPTYLPSVVAVADFNGDGKPDVAVARPDGVDILLNTTP